MAIVEVSLAWAWTAFDEGSWAVPVEAISAKESLMYPKHCRGHPIDCWPSECSAHWACCCRTSSTDGRMFHKKPPTFCSLFHKGRSMVAIVLASPFLARYVQGNSRLWSDDGTAVDVEDEGQEQTGPQVLFDATTTCASPQHADACVDDAALKMQLWRTKHTTMRSAQMPM